MTDQDTFDQLIQPYRNDMDRVALASDAKERLVSALLAKDSAVRDEAVFSEGSRTIRRFPHRARVAAALIAAALVVLTGFTVAAQGQEYWRQWFGTDEAAERIMAVGASATDRDITMEVVSAVSDANHAYYLLQVAGLPAGVEVSHSELAPSGLYLDGKPAALGDQLVGTDTESGTVNYVLTGFGSVAPGTEVELDLSGIRDRDTSFDRAVSDRPVAQLLSDEAGEYRERPRNRSIGEGEIGLLGEMEHGNLFDPEKGGLVAIKDVFVEKNTLLPAAPNGSSSVVGLDLREGVLHVLLEQDGSVTEGSVRPYLINPQTGEFLYSEYAVTYFYAEDVGEGGMAAVAQGNHPDRMYTDFAFYPFDEKKLDVMQLWVDGSTSDWQIDGTWDLMFAMPSSVPFESLEADASIECNGFGRIHHVAVTPFSIGLDVTQRSESYWEHQPQVRIVYKDGVTVDYAGRFEDETWESDSALDAGNVTISAIGLVENYEDIAALIINGTRVDLS